MGAELAAGLRAIGKINARLAVIDEAERQPRWITGVRVKAAPELTAEQRERIERLLIETGF